MTMHDLHGYPGGAFYGLGMGKFICASISVGYCWVRQK